MYRFTILFVFATIQGIFAQDYEKAIEKARLLIENHQKQTNTPGVQVALMIGDSLVWSEGFGYSNLAEKKPVKEETKFRIASVSKSVTSVALGKIIDQNKIDLDKNIRDYFPAFPKKKYVITPRDLATSTSGIRHYTNKDPLYNDVHYKEVSHSLEKFENDPLLFKPGTDYHYSSYGWVLLSAVMEKAANQSFFNLMEETWEELDMTNTSFDYPDKSIDYLSHFYVHDSKHKRKIAPFDNRSYMYAGGGYLSTATDLAKMGSGLINHTILSPEMTNELFTSHKLEDGTEIHYGLGWETGQSRIGTPIIYHSGSMSSTRSHLILYPEEKLTFVYLANTGDQIFFNSREAQIIAEIFLAEKNKEIQTKKDTLLLGKWKIRTSSLRNRRSKGTLDLKLINGMTAGTITFKRSRKKKEFPVILSEKTGSTYHLVAVSPMFIDLYITLENGTLKGEWLHDFNVKGIPEEDDYWAPNEIEGTKR